MRLTEGQRKLLQQIADGETVNLGPEPTRRIVEQLVFRGWVSAVGNVIRAKAELAITPAGLKMLEKQA